MTDPNSIFKPGYYKPMSPDGLTDEERRIAQAFIGGANVDRLNKASRAGRTFRPLPVVIHYEYWWRNGDMYMSGGWRMERVENGRRTDHYYCGEIEDEIRRLKAAGFTVREIPMDGAPTLLKPSQGTSVRRKTFEERFGNLSKGRKR